MTRRMSLCFIAKLPRGSSTGYLEFGRWFVGSVERASHASWTSFDGAVAPRCWPLKDPDGPQYAWFMGCLPPLKAVPTLCMPPRASSSGLETSSKRFLRISDVDTSSSKPASASARMTWTALTRSGPADSSGMSRARCWPSLSKPAPVSLHLSYRSRPGSSPAWNMPNSSLMCCLARTDGQLANRRAALLSVDTVPPAATRALRPAGVRVAAATASFATASAFSAAASAFSARAARSAAFGSAALAAASATSVAASALAEASDAAAWAATARVARSSSALALAAASALALAAAASARASRRAFSRFAASTARVSRGTLDA
mmetsp:Transcript_15400/g.50099  ORF Transcript_15400/g.50099 Transcript_15400/m.50099 type:complete len:320 (+) Transcript_15400:633-1592(+)